MRDLCIYSILVLTFLNIFANSGQVKRQLYVVLNPYCDVSDCDTSLTGSTNLIYIRANGENDTIHYLWSTVGSLSMLIARTDLKTNLIVDWESFLSGNCSQSISFSSPPYYTAAVVFTKLYEYDDPDNKNDITVVSNDKINPISFTNMTWETAIIQNTSSDEVSANVKISSDVGDIYGNDSIQLSFIAYGYDGHAKKLPRLLHTPHSFQLELVLDQFNTKYNKTRFVLETLMLSSESPSEEYELEKYHSIDDEYTPGVFTTVQMTSPLSRNKDWGSYLQWKPVCYKKSSSRTTEASTETKQALGNLNIVDRLNEVEASLAYAYYGEEPSTQLAGWINISYGLQGDDFYQDTNYLSWTVTIGLGIPPSETFSTLVIVIIIVGFGVPAVLIIAGGIFLLVRRLKSKDDDLNLSNAKLVEQQDD